MLPIEHPLSPAACVGIHGGGCPNLLLLPGMAFAEQRYRGYVVAYATSDAGSGGYECTEKKATTQWGAQNAWKCGLCNKAAGFVLGALPEGSADPELGQFVGAVWFNAHSITLRPACDLRYLQPGRSADDVVAPQSAALRGLVERLPTSDGAAAAVWALERSASQMAAAAASTSETLAAATVQMQATAAGISAQMAEVNAALSPALVTAAAAAAADATQCVAAATTAMDSLREGVVTVRSQLAEASTVQAAQELAAAAAAAEGALAGEREVQSLLVRCQNLQRELDLTRAELTEARSGRAAREEGALNALLEGMAKPGRQAELLRYLGGAKRSREDDESEDTTSTAEPSQRRRGGQFTADEAVCLAARALKYKGGQLFVDMDGLSADVPVKSAKDATGRVWIWAEIMNRDQVSTQPVPQLRRCVCVLSAQKR